MAESDNIEKEIQAVYEKLTEYSEKARLDSFIAYYHDYPGFLHFSSDGKMRNYEAFRKICSEYYDALEQQKISTILEKFNVIDTSLVIAGWTGNIIAQFKNGDSMKMTGYSITSVFKKIDGKWKIIHAHESALPADIVKKG